MYVCVCKAVTDGQIKHALQDGACSRRDLYKCLRVGGDCGKCIPQVKALLTAHQQECLMQNSLNPSILAA